MTKPPADRPLQTQIGRGSTSQVSTWSIRKEWIACVSGMGCAEVTGDILGNSEDARQYLITYEPGDATHYMMSVVPALWSRMADRLGTTQHPYWQIGVWSGAGLGNGTMVVEAGDDGTVFQDSEFIQEQLCCSDYSREVFSIMIHGCLGSHDPKIATEIMARIRKSGRSGFHGP